MTINAIMQLQKGDIVGIYTTLPLQLYSKSESLYSRNIYNLKNTMTGTVKTKTDRGFGFISRDGEAKDLFFHSKELNGVTFDELQVGATVTFDVADGEKGPFAKNVKLA